MGTRIEMVDSSGKENVKALKIANISKEGMTPLFTQDILDEELGNYTVLTVLGIEVHIK